MLFFKCVNIPTMMDSQAFVKLVFILGILNHASACIDLYTIAVSPCVEVPGEGDYYMDCYSKNIQQLSPDWFTCQIQTLNLDRNELTTLKNETITHITNLKSLSVRWNKITALDPAVFENLIYLEHINLDFNRLTLFEPSIPTGTFYNNVVPSLKTLKIARQENDDSDEPTYCYLHREKWICTSVIKYVW